MTTRKSKKTKPPAAPEVTIDASDIIKLAERSFTDGDANRVGTLEDLAALRTARSHILTRERDTAAAKGNEADAKALDAAVEDLGESVKAYKAQAEVAAKPQPVPKPDELIVRGVIRSHDRGLRGIKVSLTDENGPIKTATATTDASGHFELRHAIGDKTPKKLVLQIHDDRHPETIDLEPAPGVTRFVVVRIED